MKKIAITALAALIAAPAVAAPGDSDTADGRASADIIQPITITHIGEFVGFGSLIANSGGIVELRVPGIREVISGDVELVRGSTVILDAFEVSFEAGRTINFSTTDGFIFNGSESMAFSILPSCTVCSFGVNPTTGTVVVGGRLTVNANQKPGSYSGTYTATVAYQ